MIQSQAIMVVSGYNIRAVIAFCRWATAHRLKYHIVAKSSADPIFLTSYKKDVSITRNYSKLQPENFRSWVQALREQYGYHRVLILPSTEYLNRFLLENRDAIESENCVIPLVNSLLYKSISDKKSFASLCESYGLDIPLEFDNVPKQFPFVAKPRTYLSTKGRQLVPHIVNNQHDLDKLCKEEDAKNYFFQQFIWGQSHYLLAYIGQKGIDIVFSQENLMQQAHGGSIILAKASEFHQTSVAQRYVEMLHDLNFSGLIMIEVRLDKSNDRYVMIEANPRLWGPMQFLIDNNVDCFGAMLLDYDFEGLQPNSTFSQEKHYFWSGGITQKSQPIAYHNYSDSQFVRELPSLQSQDIFFRNDTIDLFFKESQMRIYEK